MMQSRWDFCISEQDASFINTQDQTLLPGRVADGSGRVAGRVEPQKSPSTLGTDDRTA